MEAKDRIESGDLELYVFGVLPEDEMTTISKEIQESEELQKEIEKIEKSVLAFSQTLSPGVKPEQFVSLYQSLKENEVPVRSISSAPKWVSYIGWAASVALVVALWLNNEKVTSTEEELKLVQEEKTKVEESLDSASESLQLSQEAIAFFRNEDVMRVALPANDAVAPEAFAQVFYNESAGKAIIDISGLPEAPEGMVYQAWSLLLDPLTPRSIGLLEATDQSSLYLISVDNVPVSEAFGITLEPEGGSESPTLEQLYVLGTV